MSAFWPRYRRELNTEGPFVNEPDRLWTMHVIEWLWCEFIFKVPRVPMGDEKQGQNQDDLRQYAVIHPLCAGCAAEHGIPVSDETTTNVKPRGNA